MLALVQNRAVEKAVDATTKQLETIDRELFPANEPDLATLHQGRLGDCYLTIFNPWGNHFTPKGPPGLANGYPTEHGQFTVPLDHLMQFVTQLVYETDKPLGK